MLLIHALALAVTIAADTTHPKIDRFTLTQQFGLVHGRSKGATVGFLGGRAATSYVHLIGPRASVAQSIELLPNFREGSDLRINTETALVAPFTRNAAVKLSYVIRYDGLPEPGYFNPDRLFTSGIQVTL